MKNSKIPKYRFCITSKSTTKTKIGIFGLVDIHNYSVLCENWLFFLQYGIFLTFCDMCPAKTSIKSTVLIFQQQMTPFWKEERLGYNICKNKENLFFWAGPPYTLKIAYTATLPCLLVFTKFADPLLLAA